MVYDGQMDKECVQICDSLNSLEGIETFESCCGHGNDTFRVYFSAKDVGSLHPLLVRLHEWPSWKVETAWASGGNGIYFILIGPVSAFNDANQLAFWLDQRF